MSKLKALRDIIKKAPKLISNAASKNKDGYTSMFFGFFRKGDKTSDPLKEGLVSKFYSPSGAKWGNINHDNKDGNYLHQLKAIKNDKKYYGDSDDPIKVKIDHEPTRPKQKVDDAKKMNRLEETMKKHYDFGPHIGSAEINHLSLPPSHHPDYEHRQSILKYTQGSTHINQYVAKGIDHGDRIMWHAKYLKSALKKYTTPHDFAVHTGLSKSAIKQLHESPGENKHGHFKIHLPAFTSCSLSRSTAKNFSSRDEAGDKYFHYVTIHVPKGSHGAYVDHVSANRGEREFILHPGAKVHIDREPHIEHKIKTVNWTGRLVHDGVKDV